MAVFSISPISTAWERSLHVSTRPAHLQAGAANLITEVTSPDDIFAPTWLQEGVDRGSAPCYRAGAGGGPTTGCV